MSDQNDITHRLRCKYANGPMVNGEPEFGWRDMSCTIMTAFPTPIDLEAANLIEQLQAELAQAREQAADLRETNEILRTIRQDIEDRMIQSNLNNANTVMYLRQELKSKSKAYGLLHAENEQLRASLAASMRWIPIAEAGLRDGETVDLMQLDPKFHRTKCIYRAASFDFELPNGIGLYMPAAMVSHILRITPPAASKGESHEQ